MKEKDINKMIKTAVDHSVPDVLDSILSACEEQEGHVIQMSEKKISEKNTIRKKRINSGWIKGLSLVAAAMVLLVVGLGGRNIYRARTVDSIISFDINPSLLMKVNKNERVLDVEPLNKEGEIVIGEMNFKNSDLEMAINALIGSMLRNGYIDEIDNSILITVENKDKDKGASLQAKLVDEVDSILSANSINGAILSQPVADDDRIKTLADENKISIGKAQLVDQLVEKDPRYRFEELAKLSINQLNVLIDSHEFQLEDVSTTGKASDKAYIGIENALKAALNHAGVDSALVKNVEVDLDYDDGRLIYEVEFDTKDGEYEYEIDAITGQVLFYEIDIDDDYDDDNDDDYDDENYDKDDDDDDDDDDDKWKDRDKDKDKPQDKNKDREDDDDDDDDDDDRKKSSSKNQNTVSMLSAADARKKVIQKFDGGIIQKIEYNYDDKNPLYKGEALKAGYEVDFELSAKTEKFEKWDVDKDDEWDEFSPALPNMITMDQAADSIISKSGKPNTFVQKIEFDWDDSEPMYKGEAFNKGYKYTFEINAYNGSFMKWDIDKDDDDWEEEYYNVK